MLYLKQSEKEQTTQRQQKERNHKYHSRNKWNRD